MLLKDSLNGKKTLYIVTDVFTRRYFSGINVSEGTLVIHGEKKYYFTDARYNYAVQQKLNNSSVISKLIVDSNTIKEFALSLDFDVLMLDYEKTTIAEYEEYKKWNKEIHNSSEQFLNIRKIKTAEELKNIQKACAITEKAYHEVIHQVKLGMTEKNLRDMIEEKMLSLGAEEKSFDTIVAFSANSAIPHHETGDTVLERDSVILIDVGCRVNGYCSDYTRTAFLGKPSKEFIDAYNAVKLANEFAIDNIKSGTSCFEADKFARDTLKTYNLDEYFTHSLGHGLGLEIHEPPTLSPRAREDKLEENMVFTVEPGVYLNGKFGIRIEDTVTIENGKAKRLFSDSKELIII